MGDYIRMGLTRGEFGKPGYLGSLEKSYIEFFTTGQANR